MVRMTRLFALLIISIAAMAQVDDATLRQYNEIVDKEHKGGRISQQERSLLMSVYPKMNPPRDAMGMTPLNELGKSLYHGEQGGLYPGGTNTPPPEHLKAGLEMARRVVPLDKEGKPAADGKIVLLSIGMSNTTMEFQTFMKRAAEDRRVSSRVTLVDGAQGGQSAVETGDPQSNYWKQVDQRIAASGASAKQVQAVWMFQVVVAPFRPFPADAKRLQALMVDTLRIASERFPNLKIAYLSSRIYAGHALVPQNPEPHAYESGFATKWLIADQIAGFPEFNYDPERGRVRFPWVAWGPYTWADGARARKDGLKWLREDFGPDGMHPSNLGREKVAKMLLDFLKTEPTAKPWFSGQGGATIQAQAPQSQSQPQGDLAELRRKVQSGQQLTPEERQRVQQAMAQQMQQRRQQYSKDHPPQSSVALIPLTDLGTGTYKGEQGGLYPGGQNKAPSGHMQSGVRLAREIVPLDAEGRKSPDGKIVMLSVGFSNPNIEFPAFQKLAADDAAVNPKLVTVNGCVGNQASSTQADPNSNYWKIVDQRLSEAGVTAKQVQTLWIKEVVPAPAQSFPAESKKLYADLTKTLHVIHDKFPNAKIAYLSSRTYGGYTEAGGSPEPWAYESGFAVKWVVSDQIAGKLDVNFDASKGAVNAPWVAWGPYLWTDGVKGRKDGFVYLREDLREDGLHPNEKGAAKIAALMLDFFKGDPAAHPWFLKP
jgi:hypothetical protein